MEEKNIKTLAINLFLMFNIVGCMTPYIHPESERLDKLVASQKYQEEKKIFESRTGGIRYCGEVGLSEFTFKSGLKPNKSCIYPASPITVDNLHNKYKKKIARQALNQLKIMQVTSEGFIIEAPPYYETINPIFIHKTEEKNLVDGSFLDETTWVLFEYVGPYNYQTLTGPRTVHSFKRVSRDRFVKDYKGIKFYQPFNDFLIRHQLYDLVIER